VPRSPPLKHTTDYTNSGQKQRTLIQLSENTQSVKLHFFKKLPWNKSSWHSLKHCQTIVFRRQKIWQSIIMCFISF